MCYRAGVTHGKSDRLDLIRYMDHSYRKDTSDRSLLPRFSLGCSARPRADQPCHARSVGPRCGSALSQGERSAVLSLVAALRDRGRGGRHRMKLPRGAVAIATSTVLRCWMCDQCGHHDCPREGFGPHMGKKKWCGEFGVNADSFIATGRTPFPARRRRQ